MLAIAPPNNFFLLSVLRIEAFDRCNEKSPVIFCDRALHLPAVTQQSCLCHGHIIVSSFITLNENILPDKAALLLIMG